MKKPKPANLSQVIHILKRGQWDAFNYSELNRLIATYGKDQAHYSAEQRPYVVMDVNQSLLSLDIADIIFAYQLEQLRFNHRPEQLAQALRQDIAISNFSQQFNNQNGQATNIEVLVHDIVESYQWIYQQYQGFQGQQSLAQIKLNPHYENFISKMRFLYAAIADRDGEQIALLWRINLLYGFHQDDIDEILKQAMQWQKSAAIEQLTWTSPASLSGQTGRVTIRWHNGLRVFAEMRDLIQSLQAHGFDVYICDSVPIDILKALLSNPEFGFNIPESNLIGIEPRRDQQQRIMLQSLHHANLPYGKAKSQFIQKILIARYGYSPILMVGNGLKDQDLLTDFPDTQKILLINWLRDPNSAIGRMAQLAFAQYGQENGRYLLQGLDANVGAFIASPKSIRYGQSTRQAFQ
ncbi:hypothetical protein BFG52_03645 [Acinetobacter larvae]|uniref:Uncharacterized protein n=1 Tax=Acinetobacter larvae TaxID=1789224 RepID=A0A1B2M3S6_9GAMM|nr:hypothetical protein BFG52_03645 [Acinetobacter larvae]